VVEGGRFWKFAKSAVRMQERYGNTKVVDLSFH